MLGRRLLKRLTRLGLATYAMTYAMTFTVCASENPVADIIVADTAGLIVESSDTGSDTGILTEEDTGIISADDPADVPADEDIIVGNDEDDIIITDDTPTVSDDIITELTEDAVADEDMVIGTYDNEEYMETDGGTGYWNNITYLRIAVSGHTFTYQDFDIGLNMTDRAVNLVQVTGSYVQVGSENNYQMFDINTIDPSRISWGLAEIGTTVYDPEHLNTTLYGATILNSSTKFEARLDTQKAEPHCEFYIVALYDNGEGKTPRYGVGKVRVKIDLPVSVDDLEAHLTQKSLKVQTYKASNTLPVTIRTKDYNRSGDMPDYDISDVCFSNDTLSEYFNITTDPGIKDTFVITAKKEVVNDPARVSELLKKYKKGISTGLKVKVTAGGKTGVLTTVENVTITFGDEKPTAKTVKATNTLQNDLWTGPKSYSLSQLGFTGANVVKIAVPDVQKDIDVYTKYGFNISFDKKITFNPVNAKTGSGKLNVVAFIKDSSYNLPANYNVTVPVSFKTTNGTPTLSLDKSTVSLNKDADDRQTITCTVKGNTTYYPYYEVMDSKGKTKYDSSNSTVNVDIVKYGTSFYVNLNLTDSAIPGTSYKVRVFVKNNESGSKTSSYKDITVKALKDSAKMDMSISAKGSVDASVPYSVLGLTITGKNVNLYGRDGHITVNLDDQNKTDITRYFYTDVYHYNGKEFGYIENTDFSLLEAGYGGKKAVANITYVINGTPVSKTYSFKIGKSTITPKFKTAKVTLNPDNDYKSYASFVFTHNNSYSYSYKVEFTCGKDNVSNKFTYYDYGSQIDVICKDIDSMAGKTYTMKVTPYVSDTDALPAKAATATIVVQKKDTAVTMSAKTTGSIDAVKRTASTVNINLTYKNVYAYHMNVSVLNITDNKGKIDVTDKFGIPQPFANRVYFYYNDTDIEPGTYKVNIQAALVSGKNITTTASFKVVRGKTNTKINPTSVTLVNRDYTKSCPVNITRDKDVKAITNVTLGSGFDEVFTLNHDSSWDNLRIRLKNGYVEKTKKGVPITSKVKKTVPVNVYYNGSSKPDTVKLTVTIEP